MKRRSQGKRLEQSSQKKRGADVFLREGPILFSHEGALRWRHFLHAFPVQRKRDLERMWVKIGNTIQAYRRRESLSLLAVGNRTLKYNKDLPVSSKTLSELWFLGLSNIS